MSRGPGSSRLAGRPWVVTHVDWKRWRAYVEPSESRGKSKWSGDPRPYSFELSDAIRRVLLGADPAGVVMSGRARQRLEKLRKVFASRVDEESTVIAQEHVRLKWCTFAGARANAVLTTALGNVAPELLDEWSYSNLNISLRSDATGMAVMAALREARRR